MNHTTTDRPARPERSERPASPRRRVYTRRKVCRFCADKAITINFKDFQTLNHFITEGGKILPRRITGTCAKHQRCLTTAIKQARIMALIPFTSAHSLKR